MPSQALAKFIENQEDVDQLWQIHEEIAGQGPGRKHGVDVINRAAIVFITACWESYIEDAAIEAFDFMVANVPNALALPTKVRDLVTKPIFDQKDSRRVWDLADAGWRPLMAAHRQEVLDRWIGTLNTPKTAQVNRLIEELLGLANVGVQWHWQGMNAAQAGQKLDDYIAIRGNIAHRTEHDETVYRDWTTDYLGHVRSIITRTEPAISAHVAAAAGRAPW